MDKFKTRYETRDEEKLTGNGTAWNEHLQTNSLHRIVINILEYLT